MAQDTSSKKSNFISNCATQAVAFLAAYNALRQLRAEYTSEGYSFVQADFLGSNVYLSPAVITNLMSTFDIVDQLINSNTAGLAGSVGYLTNLYNCKP